MAFKFQVGFLGTNPEPYRQKAWFLEVLKQSYMISRVTFLQAAYSTVSLELKFRAVSI